MRTKAMVTPKGRIRGSVNGARIIGLVFGLPTLGATVGCALAGYYPTAPYGAGLVAALISLLVWPWFMGVKLLEDRIIIVSWYWIYRVQIIEVEYIEWVAYSGIFTRGIEPGRRDPMYRIKMLAIKRKGRILKEYPCTIGSRKSVSRVVNELRKAASLPVPDQPLSKLHREPKLPEALSHKIPRLRTNAGKERTTNLLASQSLDLNDKIQALIEAGRTAAYYENYRRAIELFCQAIALGGEEAKLDVELSLDIGSSYEAMDRLYKAEAAYRLGWVDGHNLEAGYSLATLLDVEARIKEAREIYRALIERGYGPAMYTESWYLYNEGQRAEAEDLMRRASESTDEVECADQSAADLGIWRAKRGLSDEETQSLLRRGATKAYDRSARRALNRITTGAEGR